MSTLTNFVFTWNNPPEEVDIWNAEKMDYLVYQYERGENGTLHIQGYCELKKRQRFSSAKKLINDACHVEKRMGKASEARDYCMKEDTRERGPFEFGEFVDKFPGKRNDLLPLYEAAKSGKRKAQVLEDDPACYMRHYKAFAHVVSILRPQRQPREVYLLIGAPGLGKTHYVRSTYPDCYVTPVDSKGFWFDGYEGHEVALIDDFSGQWPLKALLRVLHDWPEQLPCKGGFVWWNPKKIFITTNEQFTTWYRREDPAERESMLHAIERRITKTVNFPLFEDETVE